MNENKASEDQFVDYVGKEIYEVPEEPISIVEAKVSSDGGETWARRDVDLGGDIEESGLSSGEIFQVNGEKYEVIVGDFGLTIKPLNKPVVKKSKKRE